MNRLRLIYLCITLAMATAWGFWCDSVEYDVNAYLNLAMFLCLTTQAAVLALAGKDKYRIPGWAEWVWWVATFIEGGSLIADVVT